MAEKERARKVDLGPVGSPADFHFGRGVPSGGRDFVVSVLDIDSLIKPRREAVADEYDYSTHGHFIEKCNSYSEYLLKCYIDGTEPLVTAGEFDDIKNGGMTSFLLQGLFPETRPISLAVFVL